MFAKCFTVIIEVMENETCCGLPRLDGKMLSCRHTSSSACLVVRKRTLRIRNRVPNVLFDRRHYIQFFLSIPSTVGHDRLMANVMSGQETCPYRCSYLFPFRKKGKLVHICLHQLRANFWVKISVPCVSEKINCIKFRCMMTMMIFFVCDIVGLCRG